MAATKPLPDSIVTQGFNAWRIEQADRATVLVDGAAYYGALRSAMRRAKRSIYIAGWDINSQTRLVGESGVAEDGLPERFGEFLTALVQENPDLSVRLLLWDFSVLYLLAREFPTLALQWKTPKQIELCLDDDLPAASCHHQKIVVIDDQVAFSGGLDITIRRWDRCAHNVTQEHRCDPAGTPYLPFHDVQLLVDGAAAAALGGLFRERWARASLERLRPSRTDGDAWPDEVLPEFRSVPVAISRTDPAYMERLEIREVEQLFFDMVAAAREFIYIENQFLTSEPLAERIAQALRDNPRLEVLIVLPQATDNWFGPRAMLAGRSRCISILRNSGAAERLLVAYPEARAGDQTADVMVHSKVMIVDDRYVRIGSANICNRSMRTDTECDLTIEAVTAEHRQAIAQIRDRFLQEHCELERPGDAARAQHGGSLLAAVRAMKGEHHRLVEIPDDPNGAVEASQLEQLADPERPIDLAGFIGGGRNSPLRHRKRDIAKIVILLASILLAALLWRYSSLSYIAEPGVLMAFLDSVAASPLAPAVVLLGYVLGGLIGFPVTVLIAVTALSFGAWPGLAYAAIGSMASATVTYGLGFWLGTGSLRRLFGPRLNRIRRAVTSQGILSVTAVRLVPIAPFTVVNLAAGALGISFRDYLIGTILGIAPGLIAMTLLGDRLLRIVHNPSLFHVTILVALLVAWIGLSIGLQILLSHRERRSRER